MKENTPYPPQKPEKLLAKIILASNNDKDLVFDPFLGSGTTAVVVQKLGRKYLVYRVQQGLLSLYTKRLGRAKKDQSIQGFEDGIFLDRNYTIKN